MSFDRHASRERRNKKKEEWKVVFASMWKEAKHMIKKGDWIAFWLTLGMCVGILALAVLSTARGELKVEIIASDERFVYPLNGSQSLQFDGPVGTTNVSIENEMVDVVSSPGRRQICVDAAPISQSGQWLACLPNKVFIRITGVLETDTTQNKMDAVSF